MRLHFKLSQTIKPTAMATIQIFGKYNTQLTFTRLFVFYIIVTINCKVLVCGASATRNYEETDCSLGQSRNYRGICKRIQNCPAAVSNLHAGLYPVNCLYLGGTSQTPGSRTPLVCCEADPKSRISLKKCVEYETIAERNDKANSISPSFLLPSNIPSKSEDGPKTTNDGWGPGSLEYANPAFFVVGGSNARVGQFPYMAGLGFSNNNTQGKNLPRISWLCGGTLISDLYVLTAGHCLKDVRGKGKPSFVLLGDVNLKEDDAQNGIAVDSRQIIPIQEFTIHPRYNPTTKHNDIGIIKLKKRVTFSRNVKPACLPQPTDRLEINDAFLTATGWGFTEFAGSPSETLQFVDLKRQTFQACVDAYSDKTTSSEIIPSQFCAGAGVDDTPKDTCEGDSGSGLTLRKTMSNSNFNPRFVIGITSFGSKYCGLDKPGVYTNVQSFLDWIEEVVWPPNTQ